MKLSIKSLKGIEFEGNAASLNIKTASGEITVLDHHRPLITLLTKGVGVIVFKDGTKKEIEIQSGFLEVSSDNRAQVLID